MQWINFKWFHTESQKHPSCHLSVGNTICRHMWGHVGCVPWCGWKTCGVNKMWVDVRCDCSQEPRGAGPWLPRLWPLLVIGGMWHWGALHLAWQVGVWAESPGLAVLTGPQASLWETAKTQGVVITTGYPTQTQQGPLLCGVSLFFMFSWVM